MNTATYTATMMPILMANASRHSGGYGGGDLGVFGIIFLSFICLGFIFICGIITWEMRDDIISVLLGLFLMIATFLLWIGIIFGLF